VGHGADRVAGYPLMRTRKSGHATRPTGGATSGAALQLDTVSRFRWLAAISTVGRLRKWTGPLTRRRIPQKGSDAPEDVHVAGLEGVNWKPSGKPKRNLLSAMPEDKKSTNFWMTIRKSWVPLTGCAALIAIACVLAVKASFSKRSEEDGPAAPGFVLRDQHGRLTSLAQFRGKVVLLTFIDPECTQLCPLTTQSMLDALRMLGPTAVPRVELLGLNVNVEKASVADVAAYSRLHDLGPHWRFLTGSPAQLEKVWHDYHVYVARTPDGDVQHNAVTYIIGPGGHERATLGTSMSYAAVGGEAEAFVKAVAPLLPSYPALFSPARARQQPAGPPVAAGNASLAAIGPNPAQVSFGKSHPHLLVFFAGWLGGQTDLTKDLAPLDHYAALAGRHDWPSPVAVDVLTTEPSAAAARRVLVPLAATLRTAVVEDASGRLADYYRVDDLPWYVLSSNSGKIVWYHDGWLSADALKRQVRAALADLEKEKS